MSDIRVVPCLLLQEGGLWKTTRFKDPVYVGDPTNAVRIFNEKEVDELLVMDIGAAGGRRPLDLETISNLTTECFMPLSYGGGITSIDQMARLYELGLEKVLINTAAVDAPGLIETAAMRFGSQSVAISIDVIKRRAGLRVAVDGGSRSTELDPTEHARRVEELGAGEIVLTSIDREGTGQGYDVELIRRVSDAVSIPVVAHGGAGKKEHLIEAVRAGASAVAAGSMFVFHGRHRAVLISYPSPKEKAEITRA